MSISRMIFFFYRYIFLIMSTCFEYKILDRNLLNISSKFIQPEWHMCLKYIIMEMMRNIVFVKAALFNNHATCSV